MKVAALAGGTGSAKLLRGLARVTAKLTVVANPGDNFWVHGLYVCPDIDIATYTLAGIADRARGWGIEHDTFKTLAQIAALGKPTWFRLGDRDLATHIVRTEMLRRGIPLTEVSQRLCRLLGVEQAILPATDDYLETHVLTPEGEMHLQEFWVERGARLAVRGVKYQGARSARPTAAVMRALEEADMVVFCPGNPVTSIGPMLALKGMKRKLSGLGAPVVAVSPMIGESPFSGPAGIFLRAVGARPDSIGVATLYSGLLDDLFIHSSDTLMKGRIERLGMKAHPTETAMKDKAAEVRLARELLSC